MYGESLRMLTDLKGRVKNMPLNKADALLPLFEAIVNSIQAIDERKEHGDNSRGRIQVTIQRSIKVTGQNNLDYVTTKTLPPITGFVIEDDGIGFNDRNYESFLTSDSTYKESLGGKGIGRLLWLKAFDSVHINSIFKKDNDYFVRDFDFILDEEANQNKGDVYSSSKDRILRTSIELIDFKEEYRQTVQAYKRGNTIAHKILDHCLSYYVAGSVPEIIVVDSKLSAGENKEDFVISLDDLYSEFKKNIKKDNITIGKFTFSLLHLKQYIKTPEGHGIIYCGNQRSVRRVSLSKSLGSNMFTDTEGKFTYAIYVSSPYFDQNINQSRTGFEIPDRRIVEDCIVQLPLGHPHMDMIEIEVTKVAKIYLTEYLEDIKKEKEEAVLKYIDTINPALRFVYIEHKQEILDDVEPTMKEDKIADILYKYKGTAENKILKRAREVLDTNDKEVIDLKSDVDNAINEMSEIHKSELAGYVLYRYKLLQLLQKRLEINNDGKYSLESNIHDLIYPRKKTSETLALNNHNLWVLDDKLMLHTYATSDIELKKISDSSSTDRPDVLIFKEDSIRGEVSSVTIVEFKRPDRIDRNVVDQVYGYVEELENRKIKTNTGRTIHTIKDSTVYYCYIICDFKQYESELEKMARKFQFKTMIGNLGYYCYNENYNAHVEILAYDKLVSDAKLRNYAMFNKLGLDIKDI